MSNTLTQQQQNKKEKTKTSFIHNFVSAFAEYKIEH